MHLTLKRLLWLCISIMFDLMLSETSNIRNAGLKGKQYHFHYVMLPLEYKVFFRLLCSYLRVNQVYQQVIACMTTNACPFSTERNIGKYQLLHFCEHLGSSCFRNLKNAFSGKEECIFYAF